VIVNAIFSYHHQKSLIISTAIAGGANVLFDLLLIPHYGITGSAVATLIAQTAGNWYLWHAMDQMNHFSVIPRLYRIILAGVLMGLVAQGLLLMHVEVALNILICVVVYFLLLKIFREPLLKEVVDIAYPSRAAAIAGPAV
jgi:O-antigen/teichoic acid export membrane protein